MHVCAMGSETRFAIETVRDGNRYSLDFANGVWLAITLCEPHIRRNGRQGWRKTTWLPRKNPLPRDVGATYVRRFAIEDADELHYVGVREFKRMVKEL